MFIFKEIQLFLRGNCDCHVVLDNQSNKENHSTLQTTLKPTPAGGAGESEVPQAQLPLPPPQPFLLTSADPAAYPFSPTLCLYLSLPTTTSCCINFFSSTCLASHSQGPTLHPVAPSRNLELPLTIPSPSLIKSCLPHCPAVPHTRLFRSCLTTTTFAQAGFLQKSPYLSASTSDSTLLTKLPF